MQSLIKKAYIRADVIMQIQKCNIREEMDIIEQMNDLMTNMTGLDEEKNHDADELDDIEFELDHDVYEEYDELEEELGMRVAQAVNNNQNTMNDTQALESRLAALAVKTEVPQGMK